MTLEEKNAKEYLIFELMLSLNKGNCTYCEEAYAIAKKQVEQMEKDGVFIINIYRERTGK